jgi:hypothetical protein
MVGSSVIDNKHTASAIGCSACACLLASSQHNQPSPSKVNNLTTRRQQPKTNRKGTTKERQQKQTSANKKTTITTTPPAMHWKREEQLNE